MTTDQSHTPKPHPKTLSVVVLSWNVADLLADCLRSLPGACAGWWPRTEVIVVDNASTDNSADMVRTRFPHVRLIHLPENLGFSGGNNAGIRAARGDYILLLNPDTVAHPGSISLLCDYMEAHPEAGIIGPRLLNADGSLQPSRRRFPTLTTALIESTPLQQFVPNASSLRRFYMLDRPEDAPQQVDWLSGAVLLCRREALEQAGPFDPGYFMFSEEVDLCRRVAQAGWSIAYLPAAEVTHFGGGSTDQAVPSRHINFNTSKARYFRIHEGRVLGRLVRLYLLGTYAAQSASEAAKWLLGHKRLLRAERLRMYRAVLRSGLRARPRRARKAPRVLMITGEFPPARGGVGDYTCQLAQALRREGLSCNVLTRPIEDDAQQAKNKRSAADAIRPFRIPHSAFRITAVLPFLRGTGAGVAHIQYQTGAYGMRPSINLLPLLLRWRWKRPVVVTFHDLLVPYLFPKAGPVREWANRLLARSADAAIATNEADYARLRSWGVRRVELIPIGANIPNRPPPGFDRARWRASRGIAEGTTLLAYFGFLNSTKGLDDLLQAMALLKSAAGPEGAPAIKLMMVGGGLGSSDPTNRATAEKLDALAASLGLSGDLLWTGYLEPAEVSAALLSADAAVLPYADGASFRRGSLLAALEHALPVITTIPVTPAHAIEPPVEVSFPRFDDGHNVLLVPPGDPVALASAIGRLHAQPHLREMLSRGAAKLAPNFGWESIAEMHKSLYNTLTAT
jgi:N-acetylglucosaminyl-diphospho-decaprenol L-rhamnosyltransferase